MEVLRLLAPGDVEHWSPSTKCERSLGVEGRILAARAIWLSALATLPLGVAAPAALAGPPSPVEGAWGGRTTAALPVSFEVHAGRVENARFAFTWGFCGEFESDLPNVDPIDEAGHWSFLDSRGPKIAATFVAPDRAEGTVEAPSRELPGCPKTEATFVAVPGPVPPPPPVLISDGRGQLEKRPHRISISGKGPRSFYALQWSKVELGVASAHGRALVRRGTKVLRIPVVITLAAPINRDGYRTFRRLNYRLVGPLPPHLGRWGSHALA